MTEVIRTVEEMRHRLEPLRRKNHSIGLVPTMGALHRGHLSLVSQSLEENDCTVVSIFVNPTQFGEGEDFDKYPKALERDVSQLSPLEVPFVFAPDTETIYPPPFSTYVDELEVSQGLCGSSRPTHFRGVTTVCLKLFLIVQANRAYFGQKDYQQTAVLKRMVKDLNVPIELNIGKTIREADGLALSSRNTYLSPQERKDAVVLFQALQQAKESAHHGEIQVDSLVENMRDRIKRIEGADIDYIEVRGRDDLQPLEILDRPAVAALAVRLGSTRLIDNELIDPPQGAGTSCNAS